MILTAMAISMIVPEFVARAHWHFYSGFTIVIMIMLYAVFLRMQTGPHSYFFSYSYPDKRRRPAGPPPREPSTPLSVGLLAARSEEHTSELQSLMRITYAVFCFQKKKTKKINNHTK